MLQEIPREGQWSRCWRKAGQRGTESSGERQEAPRWLEGHREVPRAQESGRLGAGTLQEAQARERGQCLLLPLCPQPRPCWKQEAKRDRVLRRSAEAAGATLALLSSGQNRASAGGSAREVDTALPRQEEEGAEPPGPGH